jgi:hypothetical protein
MKEKSLAETIRAIKPGKSKRIIGHSPNVIRATAARVLGQGNYSVAANGISFPEGAVVVNKSEREIA